MTPQTLDRPLLGILLMCGFCVLAPISDALAKLLGELVPLGMLMLGKRCPDHTLAV